MTDNPTRDYELHSSGLAEQEEKLPVCDICKEPIQEDHYYCIEEKNICSICLKDFKQVIA